MFVLTNLKDFYWRSIGRSKSQTWSHGQWEARIQEKKRGNWGFRVVKFFFLDFILLCVLDLMKLSMIFCWSYILFLTFFFGEWESNILINREVLCSQNYSWVICVTKIITPILECCILLMKSFSMLPKTLSSSGRDKDISLTLILEEVLRVSDKSMIMDNVIEIGHLLP